MRWTVACGSPRMPASSVESTKAYPAEGVEQLSFGESHVSSVTIERPRWATITCHVSVWGSLTNLLIAVPAHGIISS